MAPVTDEHLFAVLVSTAVGLALVRLWQTFVGRSRLVELVFDVGIAVLVLAVLGLIYLRVQNQLPF